MAKYSDKFFADLARLLRHGKSPLSQLICDLNDAEKRAELAKALESLRELAKDSRSKRSTRMIQRAVVPVLRPLMEEVSDPVKRGLLDDLSRQFRELEVFKDRNVLVKLAESLQIKVAQKDSRAKITGKILRRAAELPLEDARLLANQIKMLDTGSSESYKELAKFITRGNGLIL